MQWWLQIGGKPRQGKRQGQASKGPDPPSSGECNVCEDNTTKGKTQKIKDESAADLCSIDDIDGHAKPDQYGCRQRRLGRGTDRPFGRQAFLRCAAFADEALWNVHAPEP